MEKKMTIDEKYESRVKLCRILRNLEEEIEKITNTIEKYDQFNSNKKVSLSVYVDGESIQYELSQKVAERCLDYIKDEYVTQKYDIIQTLKQELR